MLKYFNRLAKKSTMEQKRYTLAFIGKGAELFGIQIVNLLLTMITLGFYYPWAKAKELKYMYGNTTLEDSAFEFTGTGEEMFKGFLKFMGILIVLLVVSALLNYFVYNGVGVFVLYLAVFGLAPLALHGSYRYRMSRTKWRGIRFGYRGNRNELVKLFFKGVILSVFTLGIYAAWFTMDLRNYIISNIRFGSATLKYKGEGSTYFRKVLIGYFLTIITLGIYSFWWQRDLFNYYVDNLWLEKGDQRINFKSTATGGGFASLMIVNILLIIFTLGLGTSWAITRTLEFVMQNIQLDGDVDLEDLQQTEEEYTDAMGEDMADYFDIDLVI